MSLRENFHLRKIHTKNSPFSWDKESFSYKRNMTKRRFTHKKGIQTADSFTDSYSIIISCENIEQNGFNFTFAFSGCIISILSAMLPLERLKLDIFRNEIKDFNFQFFM